MKKLIVGNWKLNPTTLGQARQLVRRIKKSDTYTVVLCPPPLLLAAVSELPGHTLGSQDTFWATKGPYTGQISPLQLVRLKVKYCIVGHSERRAVGETSDHIKKKIAALLDVGIIPILCVGYGTTVEDDDLEVTDVIRGQLAEDLAGTDPEKVIVAYEPVWAISGGNPFATKKVPTPSHASTVALFIKSKFGVKQVLYGGSVNSTNAAGYLAEGYIDGLLVGGASLLPTDFNGITSTVIPAKAGI